MSYEAFNTYSGSKVTPFFFPDLGKMVSRRVQANQTILKGSPIGAVTSAVNAVQTITISGTPTGGTFKLTYNGFTTAAIAFDAAAAAVQTALRALPSIGGTNVTCSGGAFPGTPVVVTFGSDLAGQPVPAITVNNNSLTGGTNPAIAVAQTTTGVSAGGIKAWSGTLVSAPGVPTVSAVAGGTGFGDGTNTMPYVVTVTFYNASGETTPSQGATVMVTNTNRTIRVGAYNGVNANITGARYYVNGAYAGTTAVAGGNIAQTDLTAFQAAGGMAPQVNGCFAAVDGSHNLVGFAPFDIYTDSVGGVTFGQTSQGFEGGGTLREAPVYVEGYFRMGDLAGIDGTNGPQLSRFGRFYFGAYSDTEGIIRLG